jgi:hypothetical protein
MTTKDLPDIATIVTTLDRHRVDYLLVGGVAANSYGATRTTYDFDCLASRQPDNLARLAGAMRDLNARLRVGGLTDDEANQLPTRLDPETLARMELSTWRTNAGDFDVLSDMPDRNGRRCSYEALYERSERHDIAGVIVVVAALDDVIDSKRWANRPKDLAALPELDAIAAAQRFDTDAIVAAQVDDITVIDDDLDL